MPIIPTGNPVRAPLAVVLSCVLATAVYRFGVWLSNLIGRHHARWDDALPEDVHGRRCPVPVFFWPRKAEDPK